MLLATVLGARADPKIVHYNFTVSITRGDLINTTTCLSNGTVVPNSSFYMAGNVSLYNSDFNLTYNAAQETTQFKEFLTIREIDLACNTDSLLSTLLNTTQAVVNNTIITQNTAKDVLLLYNGSQYYLDKWTECKQVNGQISERELYTKEKYDVCSSALANNTQEKKQCDIDLESRGKDLTSCQTQVQNVQKELTTCRSDLEKKSGYGQFIFAFAAGLAVCWFWLKNKNPAPPELTEFPQG